MLSLFLACRVTWASVKGALLSGLRGSHHPSPQCEGFCSGWLPAGFPPLLRLQLDLAPVWQLGKAPLQQQLRSKVQPTPRWAASIKELTGSDDQRANSLQAGVSYCLRICSPYSGLCSISLGSLRKNNQETKGCSDRGPLCQWKEALGCELGTMPLLESKGRENLQLPTMR